MKEGFIYIYVSNESSSTNDIFFDDLEVTINESNIVQKNSYYPFGLQHASSWSRPGRENKYQFNAASELNEETQNYEMYFRSYDPVIGRMSGVDPYAEKYLSMSPYNYAANDPIYFNDPSGGISQVQQLQDRMGYGRGIFYESGGGGGGLGAGGGHRRNGGGSFANGTHWTQGLGLASITHESFMMTVGQMIRLADKRTELGESSTSTYNNGRLTGFSHHSDEQGLDRASDYITYHKGWQHTIYKSADITKAMWLIETNRVDFRIIPEDTYAVACNGCQGGNKWDLDGDGKLSFGEADGWYKWGQGQAVHVKIANLDLKSVSVSDFNNPDFFKDGHPGIYVSFDGNDYVNRDQALVFGTIGLVLVSDNIVMSLGDTYDFDIKSQSNTLTRDIATMFGQQYAGWGNAYPIHITGTTKIRKK